MIEWAATPGATGSGASAVMNGLRGVMLSTALGTPRSCASLRVARHDLGAASQDRAGMVMKRANWWANQLPAK